MKYKDFLLRVKSLPNLQHQIDDQDIANWKQYLELMDEVILSDDDHYLSHSDSISEGRFFYELVRHIGKNPDEYLGRFMLARRLYNVRQSRKL